ncbi:MAG: hypothetical protein E7384_01755 [Ruminococcaceae bacterium]|nr:hypothetical protein [Oscillospiraceae bacterium]
MNGLLRKALSLILVTVITAGMFVSYRAAVAESASPVDIGYTTTASSVCKGDTVTVKFFFKNFADANIACTAFQLDVYIDPEIFTAESMKCTLDGTGAMMYTTKFNSGENKIKTIYFNTAGSLPKDSKDICNFTLKLNRDFEKATDVQLNVTLAMVLDADNNRYDVTYSSPVIKCLPLSEKENVPTTTPPSSIAPIQTISPAETETPIGTPEIGNNEENSDVKFYTVTYLDTNGRVITTEKVKEGGLAVNYKSPYRPGYDFVGWHVSEGTLKNVTSDMQVTAVYERSETLYTIEVMGGTVNGSYEPIKARYDDCVVVKMDDVSIPEGTYFVGWKKSGSDKIVSYNKTYSFLVSGSVKITPVFSESPKTSLPQTVLFDCVANSEGVIFTSENYIPEGYSYSGSGIIVTKTAGVGKSADMFVLNGASTISYRADKNARNAQFSLVSHNLTEAFYARAYLIYRNSIGEKITVYSDIDSYDPVAF